MDTECRAPTKAGRPCSATHYKDGWCRWHHPDLEAQRQAERIAGGRARSNRSRAKKQVLANGLELSEIDRALCAALARVLTGRMEPGVATAAATLARTIVSVRQVSDLEVRLQALEDQAATAGGRAS